MESAVRRYSSRKKERKNGLCTLSPHFLPCDTILWAGESSIYSPQLGNLGQTKIRIPLRSNLVTKPAQGIKAHPARGTALEICNPGMCSAQLAVKLQSLSGSSGGLCPLQEGLCSLQEAILVRTSSRQLGLSMSFTLSSFLLIYAGEGRG